MAVLEPLIPWDIEFDITKFEIVKAAEGSDEGSGTQIVEGLATTSDFDLQGDIVSQEAILASKDDLMRRSTVLLNHDENQPIGKVLEAEVRKEGLWLKVMISKKAEKVWGLIQEGILSKFSIRGKIVQAKEEWVPKLERMARVIKRMVILEASIVSVPANEGARTLHSYVQKQAELELAVHEIQDKLGGLEMANPKDVDLLKDLFTDTSADEGSGDPPGETVKDGEDVSGAEEGSPVLDDKTQTDIKDGQTDGLDQEELAKAESTMVLSQIETLVGQLLDQNKDAGQVTKLTEIKKLVLRLKGSGEEEESAEDLPIPKKKPDAEAAAGGEPKSAGLEKEVKALREENVNLKASVAEILELMKPKEEPK